MRIRDRREADIAVVADLIVAQQPITGYPAQNPLTDPVAFVRRSRLVGAWVAELNGTIVGHVCAQRAHASDDAETQREIDAWATAHDCATHEIGVVSALVVDPQATGHGIGAALMRHVTDAIAEASLRPALEVVAQHAAARRLYSRLGWTEVVEVSPEWLRRTRQGPAFGMVLR